MLTGEIRYRVGPDGLLVLQVKHGRKESKYGAVWHARWVDATVEDMQELGGCIYARKHAGGAWSVPHIPQPRGDRTG